MEIKTLKNGFALTFNRPQFTMFAASVKNCIEENFSGSLVHTGIDRIIYGIHLTTMYKRMSEQLTFPSINPKIKLTIAEALVLFDLCFNHEAIIFPGANMVELNKQIINKLQTPSK